jgi:hypothetical protein
MQRKEVRKHSSRTSKKRRKKKNLDPNRSEIPFDLFTSYMNLWNEYVKACNSMYAEYIRYTRKMTESWLDSFSKFWSGQHKDKVKVE